MLRAPVLDGEPWATMSVEQLLLAIKHHGPKRVRPLIAATGVLNPRRPVRQLTARQRGLLADALELG